MIENHVKVFKTDNPMKEFLQHSSLIEVKVERENHLECMAVDLLELSQQSSGKEVNTERENQIEQEDAFGEQCVRSGMEDTQIEIMKLQKEG